jgi:hypothetical protein
VLDVVGAVAKLGAAALQCDLAALQDVAAVGHDQRRAHVLLDEQDRDAGRRRVLDRGQQAIRPDP